MKRINTIIVALSMSFSATNAMAYTTEPSETLKVWADPITLVADGKTITNMYVCESDVYDYTAFNMAFNVPEGITIAKIKQGRETVDDCFLTERATSTHVITCGQPSPTQIKVISDSSQLQNFYPDDEDGNVMDELFYIGLIASPDMEAGEYTVEIFDVKFVLENANAFVLPQEPLYTTFTIVNEPSGVEDVLLHEDISTDEWYDLYGRKIDKPTIPGVYICNGNKVVVE